MPLSTTHNRSHSSAVGMKKGRCSTVRDEKIVMNHLEFQSWKQCWDSVSSVAAIDSSPSLDTDVKSEILHWKFQ